MIRDLKRIFILFFLAVLGTGIGLASGPEGHLPKNVVYLPNIISINLTEAVMFTGEDGDFESLLIPLKKAGRLFLIEADVDGNKGNLVFDSGADKLVLNRTYFRKNLVETQETAGGLTGEMRMVYKTRVQQVNASGLVFKQITADVVGLGTIENRRGEMILGLLGIGLFDGFELVIDLHNSMLEVHRLDKKGIRLIPAEELPPPDFRGRVTARSKVLFLKAAIAGKPVEFCLDTASETNVISNTAPGRVLETITITNRTELSGVGGADREVLRGTMNDFVLGDLKCRPMQTIVANLSSLSQAYDYPVGGILGYDFFDQGKICINLVTKEIGVILNEDMRR
jgi:hypothetical protein